MANYIRTTDNTYPHSESSIRAEFNQTSFPTPFRPPEGYEVVFQSPTPAYDPITQYVREVLPTLINEKYYQAFEVVDLSAEEIAALAEQKRIAAIPVQVSPRQIRQALTAAGLRASVEAAVAGGDQDMKDWWEFSISIERKHPLVVAMATSLGVTERQLDDLFTAAGAL